MNYYELYLLVFFFKWEGNKTCSLSYLMACTLNSVRSSDINFVAPDLLLLSFLLWLYTELYLIYWPSVLGPGPTHPRIYSFCFCFSVPHHSGASTDWVTWFLLDLVNRSNWQGKGKNQAISLPLLPFVFPSCFCNSCSSSLTSALMNSFILVPASA